MRKKTIEDYVELVYIFEKEKKPVHTNDIASAFSINPASVTEMFQKLSAEGYINYEKYGGVTLTKKGKNLAFKTKEKHDILRNFLMILGIDEGVADEDACKIEHVINPETQDKLTKFVEFVHQDKGCGRWLDHFKYFYQTGRYISCSPRDERICPVHGDIRQRTKRVKKRT